MIISVDSTHCTRIQEVGVDPPWLRPYGTATKLDGASADTYKLDIVLCGSMVHFRPANMNEGNDPRWQQEENISDAFSQ